MSVGLFPTLGLASAFRPLRPLSISWPLSGHHAIADSVKVFVDFRQFESASVSPAPLLSPSPFRCRSTTLTTLRPALFRPLVNLCRCRRSGHRFVFVRPVPVVVWSIPAGFPVVNSAVVQLLPSLAISVLLFSSFPLFGLCLTNSIFGQCLSGLLLASSLLSSVVEPSSPLQPLSGHSGCCPTTPATSWPLVCGHRRPIAVPAPSPFRPFGPSGRVFSVCRVFLAVSICFLAGLRPLAVLGCCLSLGPAVRL